MGNALLAARGGALSKMQSRRADKPLRVAAGMLRGQSFAVPALRQVMKDGIGDAALIVDDEPDVRDDHPVGVAQQMGKHVFRPCISKKSRSCYSIIPKQITRVRICCELASGGETS